MYLDYFSLEKFPFRITPDPSLFFPGGADGRGVVLDALIYAISSGEGILKVVGEVGSGKTMLCRMLGGKLSDSVEIVYLANPNLSARDIIFAIAFELELDVDSSTDRLLAMHKLQDYLLSKHSNGGSVVVFIEEAQSMPLEALEEIRLLSNLETHQHKLMQIVLFGQPELDKKLQKKSIRQLRERITHSFNLEPLSIAATREYLRFRLQAAGCPWPQLFSAKAEKKLAKAASGLTRRINILADKSLMAAYADFSTRKEPRNTAGTIQSMVLPRHVNAAIKDCGYARNRWVWLSYAGLGLVAVAIVFGATSLLEQMGNFPRLELAGDDAAQEFVYPQAGLQQSIQPVSAEDISSFEVGLEEADLVADRPVDEDLALPIAAVSTEQAVMSYEEERISASIEGIENIDGNVVVNLAEQALPAPQQVEALGVAENKLTPAPILLQASVEELKEDQGELEIASLSLVAQREKATQGWLRSLPNNAGYTLQLISIATSNEDSLEEFLQFFSVAGLLEETYVCTISETLNSPEQWLVLHGEFEGVTAARNYVAGLPVHLRRYSPFIRNTNDVACRID